MNINEMNKEMWEQCGNCDGLGFTEVLNVTEDCSVCGGVGGWWLWTDEVDNERA